MSFIYSMTDAWNAIGTTFTAIKMTVTDTASAAGSKLIDLIVGSTHMFQVGKNGHVAVGAGNDVDNNPFTGPAHIALNLNDTYSAEPDAAAFSTASLLTYDPSADEASGPGFTGNLNWLYVPATNTKNIISSFSLFGGGLYVGNHGSSGDIYGSNVTIEKENGSIGNIWGRLDTVAIKNATVANVYGVVGQIGPDSGADIGTAYAVAASPSFFGGTIATYIGFWSPSLASGDIGSVTITNPYYFWSDGPGVFRIKEEGAVKGAVPAWYNPNFTKYTPGAVNFERGVLQWAAGDIVEIGAEAGGTGTLRKVRHLGAGHIFPLANMPTADPGVAGEMFTVGAPTAGVPKALMISGG